MVQINVTHELPELVNHLQQLEQKLDGDLTPLMIKIGGILEGSSKQRFDDKKSPDGVSWKNLKPSTIARKGNHNILIDSNNLHKGILNQVTAHSVVVGTPEFYGKYHQFGTKSMPARQFLGISEQDKEDILDEIQAYVNGEI